jgi:8-oxo-dGTP pyrophosphatase MutT (NUDIX family)
VSRQPIVSGVLIRDGRILLTQRLPNKSFAFCWETPGGKVDPGESLVDALAREWMEELRLDILTETEPKPELLRTVEYRRSVTVERRDGGRALFGAGDDVVPVTFYRVYAGEQTPQMKEAIGLAWATAPLVNAMALTPGTYKMRDYILGLLETDPFRDQGGAIERPRAPDPAR